jgi:hypothetical protein
MVGVRLGLTAEGLAFQGRQSVHEHERVLWQPAGSIGAIAGAFSMPSFTTPTVTVIASRPAAPIWTRQGSCWGAKSGPPRPPLPIGSSRSHTPFATPWTTCLSRGCLDCAADTVSFYRIKSGHVVRLLGGDLPLDRLSSNVVRDYIQVRRDEGAKDTTVVKEIITLRRAVKLAHETGRFPANPKEVIPRFRVRYQPRERWLTPKQVRALLRQLGPHRRLWSAKRGPPTRSWCGGAMSDAISPRPARGRRSRRCRRTT